MNRIKKLLLIVILLIPLVGCQSQKNEWKGTYYLTYFYLKDCSNCQHFKKNVLPAIKKEFGKHMKISHVFSARCYKAYPTQAECPHAAKVKITD